MYMPDTSKPVKFFLDTEFIESPGTIDLISIGIVSDTGREYYAVSSEFKVENANNWVRKNVLRGLPEPSLRKSKAVIAQEILRYVHEETSTPEFWGYYSSYDWVVLCWLYGKMISLPSGFPMYCLDVNQLMKYTGASVLPPPKGAHNALVDAKWTKDLYYHVSNTEQRYE